jgi:hypothetical protein
MNHVIRRITALQAAKVAAILYGIMGILYVPLGMLADAASPPEQRLGLLWLFSPVAFAVLSWVAVAIGCALYNKVAGWVGGIEIELEVES